MAFDERAVQSVALKILARTFSADGDPWSVLRREHALVCELDHPRILKTYPPLCAGDLAILPMQLATGGELRQLRGAPYVEIIPPLIDLAHALDYVHAHGVVHRDLKAANVLFDSLGRVQLADFGVAARMLEGLPVGAERSGCSPSTASPQQLLGLPPSPSDDLYGLGALALELLTGAPAYFPDFDARQVLHGPLPAIEPVHLAPPRLLGLVRALMARSPRHRLRSMAEVIAVLTAALDDPPTREYWQLGASARLLGTPATVTSEW